MRHNYFYPPRTVPRPPTAEVDGGKDKLGPKSQTQTDSDSGSQAGNWWW